MNERKVMACKASEVAPGRQKIVRVGKRPIGIFQIGDAYFALLNVCPHRGGRLCEGPQCGTTMPSDGYKFIYGRDQCLVRCAWHGWEFDIRTGESLVDPSVKAKTFKVSVEEDTLFVHLE